jgi:hypothetical protein
MEAALLQDLRAANQAITRFVSEVSTAKESPRPQSYHLNVDSLMSQINKIAKALGTLPAPGWRDAALETELRIYVINLRLLKKTVEELEPLLKEKARLLKEALDRLSAARNWSESLEDLSK